MKNNAWNNKKLKSTKNISDVAAGRDTNSPQLIESLPDTTNSDGCYKVA